MDEYIIPVGLDAGSLLKGIQDSATGLSKLTDKADEAARALQDGLERGAKAATKLDDALGPTLPANLGKAADAADKVDKSLRDVETSLKAATNDEHTNRFQRAFNKIRELITGTSKDMGGLTNATTKATGQTNIYRDAAGRLRNELGHFVSEGTKGVAAVGNEAEKAQSKFGSLGQTILGVFAGNLFGKLLDGAIDLGKRVIETTANFQKFEAVLTNTLGSNSEAKKAMAQIVDFATKTPFAVDELTESFIKFANRGIILTREEMTKLGDVASSQGKSFDQLTEAILDAQTGEFERLKEFGIRASKAGDQVTVSFGNVSKTVKNSEKDIRDAIIAIGDQDGVKGGMESISKTLGGQLSNLQDSFTNFLKNIGDGASNGLGKAVAILSDLLGYVNDLIASGAVSKFFDPITSAIGGLYDIAVNAAAAVSKFGEESGIFPKVKLFVDALVNAVAGLFTYIGLVADATVDFFTKTELGQAIIGQVVEAFKNLLGVATDVLQIIGELPFVFITIRAAGEQFVTNVVNSFKILGETVDQVGLQIKKAFTFDADVDAQIQKQIDAAEARKRQLQAGQRDITKVADEAYNAAKAQALAEKKARDEVRAKEAAANIVDDSPVKGRAQSAAPTTTALTEAQLRKQEAALKKQNDQLNSLAKQLRDTQLAAMEEGFAKERAVVEANYKDKVAAATKDKILTAEAGQIQKQLLAQLSADKIKELENINKKEVAANTALEVESAKIITNLSKETLKGRLEAINADFDAQEAKIREKYKNRADLEKRLIEALEAARQQATAQASAADQIKTLEAQERLSLRIIDEFGAKKLAVDKDVSATEQNIAEENKIRIGEIEASKALSRLAIELTTAKKILEIQEAAYGKESDQAKAAKETIDKLEVEIRGAIKERTAGIDISGLFDLSKIGQGLGDSLKQAFALKGSAGGKSLGESLGLSPDEQETIVASFTAVFDVIKQLYAEMIQSQIDEKDRQIAALDEQISQTSELYDKEVEMQKQGYANNAAAKGEELEKLKKQREKDQADKEALQKKAAALAKIQIAVSTAVTLASLIAGAAQAIAAHASIPFVGVAFGLAAAAALVSGYLAFKAQSQKAAAAPESQSFAIGGWIDGESHERGGKKYYSKDGTGVVELEKGEHVTRKKQAKKYAPILNAINKGSFANLTVNEPSFVEMLAGMGIRLEDDTKKEAIYANRELSQKVVVMTYGGGNDSQDKHLKNIDESTALLARAETLKETVTYENGYKIYTSGNSVRRVKMTT